MNYLIRLIFFLATMLLAGIVSRWTRVGSRRVEYFFIGWMLLACLLPGFLRKDIWPFSLYPFIAETVDGDPIATKVMIVVLNEKGEEFLVQSEVWDPYSTFELNRLIEQNVDSWSQEDRRVIAQFLLDRVRRYKEMSARARLIRALAAPDPLIEPGDPLPAGELTALRVYLDRWHPRSRLFAGTPVQRAMLFEVRDP